MTNWFTFPSIYLKMYSVSFPNRHHDVKSLEVGEMVQKLKKKKLNIPRTKCDFSMKWNSILLQGLIFRSYHNVKPNEIWALISVWVLKYEYV